ncbi:MAG: VacJ family lipoprotein [Gammaproteobacteria bacterium]|nr:VacJ family lipoprotein [Gammaproteobacteria bacterium]
MQATTTNVPVNSVYLLLLVISLALLGGCASVPGPPDERDPFESYNRAMYAFNDSVDNAVLRPVAQTYKDYTPDVLQTGISNFFDNIGDLTVMVNNLLQFKIENAVSDFGRILWNSTVGIFGLIDVASHMGLQKHDEDFGQTLAVWGVPDGPYIVLPLLGPSNARDTVGLVGDIYVDPLFQIEEEGNVYWGAVILRFIDTRADLLSASRILEQAAIDPYIFVRDAYFQHRRNLIYDGNPPLDETMEFDPATDADLQLELELELELQETTPDSPPSPEQVP